MCEVKRTKSDIIQLLPVLKVNSIIVHPRDEQLPALKVNIIIVHPRGEQL
jgi:hypothetical protein